MDSNITANGFRLCEVLTPQLHIFPLYAARFFSWLTPSLLILATWWVTFIMQIHTRAIAIPNHPKLFLPFAGNAGVNISRPGWSMTRKLLDIAEICSVPQKPTASPLISYRCLWVRLFAAISLHPCMSFTKLVIILTFTNATQRMRFLLSVGMTLLVTPLQTAILSALPTKSQLF